MCGKVTDLTALKTLTLYLRAAKTEAEDAGISTEGMATSVSKLRSEILALTNNKVDIMIDEDTFKSTYEIMKEIAGVWEELSDVTQANLTNLIGGKRNANVISSLVRNFQDAERAAKTAAESMGSAMRENEKYLNSIEGKISVFKATFEDLSRNIIDSDAVKAVVDMGTGLLNVLNALAKIKLLAPALLAIITAIQTMRSRNEVASVVSTFESMVRMGQSSSDVMKMLAAQTAQFSTAQQRMLSGLLQSNSAWGAFKSGAAESAAAIADMGTKATGASGAIASLWSSFKGMSLVGQISVVGTVLMTVVSIITTVKHAIEAAREAAIQAAHDIIDRYHDAQSTYTNNMDELQRLKEQYATLSLGVDANGENVSLAASDYETYLSVVQRIIELSPDVVQGYDNEGKAIVNYTTLIKEATAAQEKLNKEARDTYLASGNELFKGTAAEYKKLLANESDVAEDLRLSIGMLTVGTMSDESLEPFRAILDFFDSFGITVANFDEEFPKHMRGIYDQVDSLSVAMRQTGVYEDWQIDDALDLVRSLAEVYSQMDNLRGQEAEYLMEWSKGEDWFSSLPSDAVDEYYNAILNIIDATDSVDQARQRIRGLGEDLASAFNNPASDDDLKMMTAFIEQYRTGQISMQELQAYFETFKNIAGQIYDPNVGNTLISYLQEVIDGLGDVETASVSTAASIDTLLGSVNGLLDSYEQLKKGRDVAQTAVKEMENGGLSGDTVNTIAGMLGNGESIIDYIQSENGVLTLNIEKWNERNSAMMNADLDAYQQAYNLLSAERDIANAEGDNARTRELTVQIDKMSQLIGIYKSILAEGSTSKTDILTSMFGDIDSAKEKIASLGSAYQSAISGAALSVEDLMRLADQYPDFMNFWSGDLSNASDQAESIHQYADYLRKEISGALASAQRQIGDAIVSGTYGDMGFDSVAAAQRSAQYIAIMRSQIATTDELLGKTAETKDAYTRLSEAIDAVNKSSGWLTTINSGSGGLLDMLTSASEMAKTTGKSLSDFLTFDGGTASWNAGAADTITTWVYDIIDGLDGVDGMSEEAREALKQLVVAEVESASAAEKIADSYDRATKAISGISDATSGAELTFKAYQELINIDARYATAVEYQNGVLTLNSEKYNQVTQAIADETVALAKSQAQAILTSEEYKDLTNRIGNLSDEEQKRLDSLNAEIMGYQVLASEIENATSAYNRFLNADSKADSTGYSAARSAFDVITDTLKNKDSAIYGMVGRDQFKAAMEFLITPEVEFNSEEFWRQMEVIERYLSDGKQGIDNFVADLYSAGFVDANDKLTGTLDEMAAKLGVSVPLLRELFNQLNQYLENPIDISEVDTTAIEGLDSSTTGAKESADALSESMAAVATQSAETGAKLVEAKESATSMGEAAQSAEEKLESLQKKINELNPAVISLDAKGFILVAGSAESALSKIVNKILQIQSLSNITLRVSTVTSSLSALMGQVAALRGSGLASAGGTSDSPGGKTLVGEVGTETVIDPANNVWYTVGNNGPEFVNLPRNAIVLNAQQTQELFARGRASGSGVAMASGSDKVSGGLGGYKITSDTSKKSSSTSKSSTAKSATTAAQEQENAIQKLVEAYDKLDKEIQHLTEHQDRLYKEAEKSSNLEGMEAALRKQIDLQRQIIEKSQSAMKEMKALGLKDTDEEFQKIEQSFWQASDNISSIMDQIRTLYFDKYQEQYNDLADYTNHLIEHQQHLFSEAQRGLEYEAAAAALVGQAQFTEKMMRDAQNTIQKMLAKGAKDTDKQLQAVEKAYWESYESLNSILDQLGTLFTDALNQQIDDIQSAYSTLTTAVEQLNEHQGVSVDVFQALANQGLQYLSVLDLIDDEYVINEEAVERLIQAETQQLAIEESMNYVRQLEQALLAGNSQAVANLVNLTNQLSNATWDAVYAQAEMLLNLGLAADQYDIVLGNIQKMQSISVRTISNLSYSFNKVSSSASTTKTATKETADYLDKIVDYTKELIKYETNEHINAINDEIEKYQNLIDLKKESLRAARDEDSYAKDIAAKTKEIAQLQARINQLSLDDTRSARAERAQLETELAELQADLNDTQGDHAYEMQTDVLDKMSEAYEESRQAEIQALEDSIASEELLYRQAIERIQNHWGTLYQDLINWNTEAGNHLNNEITDNWQKALSAAQKYGSYVKALSHFDSEYAPSAELLASIAKAKQNGTSVVPKFHSGGSVGNLRNVKDNEVLALLEKNELVLDEPKKSGLYKIVDWYSELSKRVGAAISSISLPRLSQPLPLAVAGATPTGGIGGAFSPIFNVTVNSNGSMSDAEASRIGSRIGETAANELYEAFQKKGIGGRLSSRLQ